MAVKRSSLRPDAMNELIRTASKMIYFMLEKTHLRETGSEQIRGTVIFFFKKIWPKIERFNVSFLNAKFLRLKFD